MRAALVSALVLTSPLLSFARCEPAKIHAYNNSDIRKPICMPAVNQGKGSGHFRYSPIGVRVKSQNGVSPNWADSALRK